MFQRILKPLKSSSFFLFGPRGTGKSTLLSSFFTLDEVHVIDLLDIEQEDLFIRRPNELQYQIDALPANVEWVIIDEIQKVPRLQI